MIGLKTSLLILIIPLLCPAFSWAQPLNNSSTLSFWEPDSVPNKKRYLPLTVGLIGLETGGILGLSQLWYKNYPKQPFSFFNDNKEWQQIDKVGHLYTAYHFGKFGIHMYKWAGLNQQQAAWAGGFHGFVFLMAIEVLDGYSAGWGFSTGDLIANTAGSALAIGQQLAFDEQRLFLKFSFAPTPFANQRPDVLGSSFIEQFLKDYNGQRYWLSYAPIKKTPWLCISGGYGATGMYGGMENPPPFQDVDRYRQYYFSLDINFEKIQTNSKGLKMLFYGLNMIKMPFPALRFDKNGVGISPLSY